MAAGGGQPELTQRADDDDGEEVEPARIDQRTEDPAAVAEQQ